MDVTFKIHSCTWFPPKGYVAITLFNHIIFKGTKEYVEELLQTHYGKTIVNHERIHVIQGETLGWLKFYILYLYYYIENRRQGYSHNVAYHRIPFEAEAFANEENFSYSDTHWESYIYPLNK